MILFETDRIKLRQLVDDDADFILALYSSKPFKQYIGDKGVNTLESAYAFIADKASLYQQGSHGIFVIEQKLSGNAIGVVSFFKRQWLSCDDVGYALLPEYFGQGYSFEATKEFIDYISESKRIECICALVAADNQRSLNLLKKLNFRFKKEIRDPENREKVHWYQNSDSTCR